MRKQIIAVMLVALCMASLQFAAGAEPFNLAIPGQGWSIAFDTPPLISFMGQTKNKNFQFQAVSETGLNILIYVEEPKSKVQTNDACFEHYWPLAKRNPKIDQASVKVTKEKRYVKVSYNIKIGDGEDKVKSPRINYYFVFNDRWIEMHVSRYPAGKDDEEVLRAFEKTLSYKATKVEDKAR